MYKRKTISAVFPAYNEEENIRQAIRDFQQCRLIDQIIVVDNNSTDKTAQYATQLGATVVTEKKQGYGFALRKGLAVADCDYIILSEPDGTFSVRDLPRLLIPLSKYDAVLGTRTNQKYIHPHANMKFLLRWGNILLAKVLQLLHRTTSLSDCGCTFRVIKKSALQKILPHLSVGSSHFLPEMVLLLSAYNCSFIEKPVHYYPRVGTSKITGSFKRALVVGWNMARLIFGHFFLPKSISTK